MAKKIISIGLKSVKYATPAQTGIPSEFPKSISVVHADTWALEMTEAQYQKYINMLTKKPYYIEKTQEAEQKMKFSIGQYTLEEKKEFMGGTITAATASANETWVPGNGEVIHLAIQAVTEDDVQITYPYAFISASHGKNLNAYGLNVTAEPVQHPDGTTPPEKWELLGTKTA